MGFPRKPPRPLPPHLKNLYGPVQAAKSPEEAIDLSRFVLGGLYDHASKGAEPVKPKIPSVINYAPAYRIDEPIRFMGQETSGPIAISRTTPAEYTMQMNGPERGMQIIENWRKRNADGGSPLLEISPRGLDDHLNRPLYVIRGANGSIDMPNSYGQASTSLGYAAWNSDPQVTARATDAHEMSHLQNSYDIEDLWNLPYGKSSPWYSPEEGAAAMEEASASVIGKIRHGDEIPNAEEALNVASRLIDPGNGHAELQAILPHLKRDGEQIYGIPKTEKQEIGLLRKLLTDPLDLESPVPTYQYGPRKGRPAYYFNEQRNGLKTFWDQLPDKKNQKDWMIDMFRRSLSDNSSQSENQYA